MRSVLSALCHELRFLLRTPPVVLVILIPPVVYPFMYNYLYVNKFETKIPVVVIDQDKSSLSRALIRALDATEQVTVQRVEPGMADGGRIIDSRAAEAVFVVPEGYEGDLVRNRRTAIRAYVNTTRFMVAVDVGKGLSEALASVGRERLLQKFAASGCTRSVASAWSQPIVLRSEGLANASENYGDYIIPALLLLILQQSLFAGTAVASAGMGRRGRRVEGGAARSIVGGLIGRAAPYMVLYCGYAFLFFTVQYRLWHIPLSSHGTVLAVLTLLHLAAMTAAGFLLGSLCRSRLTALLISMFSSYPMFLLSGLAWPRTSMPPLLRGIGAALPSTHFFPAAMAASRLHAGWAEVLPEVAALAAVLAGLALSLVIVQVVQKKR